MEDQFATPVPQQSVAQLLEQLIAIAQQQLQVAQESLQNQQAANTTLEQLQMLATKNLQIATQALSVAQLTLESSRRIEALLGGEPVPFAMRVTYEHHLSKKAARKGAN